jgi:hypothetical protein
MQLSENFHLAEFTSSQEATRRGIDNTPSEDVINNLIELCINVLEPVRISWNAPVVISSGYRSRELNTAIGGSTSSQHCYGEAADFEIYGVDNCELASWIADYLMFDQLILEFHEHGLDPNSGWVHVSYTATKKNRLEVLTAKKNNGQTIYLPGLRK